MSTPQQVAYLEEVLTLRGKSWVRWSKGLKSRFGILEINDTEARKIGEREERQLEIAAMSGMDYMGITWRNRGKLLDVVSSSGLDDVGGLAECGVRAVAGRDGSLPRIVDLFEGEHSDSGEYDFPKYPEPEQQPERSLAADIMPSSPLYRSKDGPAGHSPPLPFDSDILPYPLSQLGNIKTIPRITNDKSCFKTDG